MIVCDTGPLVAAAFSKDPDYHRYVEPFTGLHLANRRTCCPAVIALAERLRVSIDKVYGATISTKRSFPQNEIATKNVTGREFKSTKLGRHFEDRTIQ